MNNLYLTSDLNIKNASSGMSLIEALIAALLLSMIILGAHQFYVVLVVDIEEKSEQFLAESIAFQLLDVLSSTASQTSLQTEQQSTSQIFLQASYTILPDGWTSRQDSYYFNSRCKLMVIEVATKKKKSVHQKRIICNRYNESIGDNNGF